MFNRFKIENKISQAVSFKIIKLFFIIGAMGSKYPIKTKVLITNLFIDISTEETQSNNY